MRLCFDHKTVNYSRFFSQSNKFWTDTVNGRTLESVQVDRYGVKETFLFGHYCYNIPAVLTIYLEVPTCGPCYGPCDLVIDDNKNNDN